MKTESLLTLLEGVRSRGPGKWSARCPAHDDKSPSLSIAEADGTILLYCHARCSLPSICAALGVEMKILFPDKNEQSPQIMATFDYRDEGGQLLFQVVRFEPKNFRQRRPDGHGGWIWDLKETRRVLYRLPDVLQATEESIVIHEGEKAVEAARKAGLPGAHTTTVCGANAPRKTDFSHVKGRNVVICPDNDEPGEKYLRDVAGMATAAGASSVKVLRLHGLPPKGDVVEWIEAGGTAEAFTTLLEQAEPVEPVTIQPPTATSRAIFRRVSDIQAKPIRWLWEGRIARGKVSMIAGNPGLGKSQVAASTAAVVSTGGTWPVDGTPCEVGNVVILSAEDDPEDTIRPRLEAAGADLSRLFILDAIVEETLADGPEIRRGFDLKSDLSRLGAMLEEIGGAALVVIDPITAYLGTTDSHKNAEIRALLSPLSELAAKHGAAVVCVSHFNKNSTGEALMRVTGSLAFVAAARAVFVVARDPEDDTRRLFLPLKNNLGNDQSGLAFSVESVQLDSAQGPIKTSRVSWHAGTVTTTAEAVMSPQPAGEERSDLDEAKRFLRGLLAEGPLTSKEIRKDAEGAGHAWRTIQRAQKALGVTAYKAGMRGGWLWRLDPHSTTEERQDSPKSATHGDWHSSGRVGGLRAGNGGPVRETSEAEEVVDLC